MVPDILECIEHPPLPHHPTPNTHTARNHLVQSVTNAKTGETSVKKYDSKTKKNPIHQKYCYLEDNCHQEWCS